MAALRGPVAEVLAEIEQFAERGSAADVHDAAVVFRPFLGEAVGTVVLQFMGEVAAGDEYGPSAEVFRSLRDHLAEAVVIGQRQAGQADAHDLAAGIVLPDEPQRHHRAMVQRRVPFAQRTCGETGRVCQRADSPDELRIVLLRKAHQRRVELAEGALRATARRDVEIVRVHHGMRTGDENRIRLERGNFRSDLLVRARRFRHLRLAAPADGRNDHGRVRDHKSSKNRHVIASFIHLYHTIKTCPRGIL